MYEETSLVLEYFFSKLTEIKTRKVNIFNFFMMPV